MYIYMYNSPHKTLFQQRCCIYIYKITCSKCQIFYIGSTILRPTHNRIQGGYIQQQLFRLQTAQSLPNQWQRPPSLPLVEGCIPSSILQPFHSTYSCSMSVFYKKNIVAVIHITKTYIYIYIYITKIRNLCDSLTCIETGTVRYNSIQTSRSNSCSLTLSVSNYSVLYLPQVYYTGQ